MQKNIRLLGLFNFFTDFRPYSAILIIYFQQITGSYALGMSLFSVTMISSALLEIPTGIFSDYIWRKKTIMLGALSSLLAVVFYAIGINYGILLVGALLEGLQRAWYSGNNDALLYETLSHADKQEDYDHHLGKVSSMFQLVSAIAIIFGGIIASFSFALIMWLSVIPQLICLSISFQITEPKKHSQRSANIYSHLTNSGKKIWKNKKLRSLSIANIVSYMVGESTFQFRSAFVNTLWPLWAVGIAKVISNFGAAASYWYGGRLIRKIKGYRLLLVSSIYSKVINIFSVAVVTVASPVFLASTSLFYGATQVAKSKLMQKEFTDEQRATLGSINSFAGSLAFGIFAVVLGIFADQLGTRNALLISYFVSVPAVVIYWNLFKDNKGE